MALIVCSECGKEFSERAAACPHCVCPNDSKKAEPPLVRDGVSGCVNGVVAEGTQLVSNIRGLSNPQSPGCAVQQTLFSSSEICFHHLPIPIIGNGVPSKICSILWMQARPLTGTELLASKVRIWVLVASHSSEMNRTHASEKHLAMPESLWEGFIALQP
ncbi:hypothetical protein OMCYN_01725 [cyanobiont of Ornithocercus magnificus]|nr:hypothetical protein OMCYN_01725 [cyanobiont of Ornithocercus magnificus]